MFPLALDVRWFYFSIARGGACDSALTNPLVLKATFLWLFSLILGSALSVVRHAEHLAVRLGEPFGTLNLTLSVTLIEVMGISAIMPHGETSRPQNTDKLDIASH
jgi:Ca2+:H+ antiporter